MASSFPGCILWFTEDIETRMALRHKHVDQILNYFTFGKEHLEDIVPENQLQIFPGAFCMTYLNIAEVSPFLKCSRFDHAIPRYYCPRSTKSWHGIWNICTFYAINIKYLYHFCTWLPSLFMIGYSQNFLISQWKGVTRNVYSKRYPYTSSESVFIHQSRQRTGPLVHLYHFGIHHSFYHFHLFKCFSVHQYAFRLKCEPTSILHIYGIQQTSMG